ncbi:MAG TPA: GNAT family N-acetyltransferase [bacterium]|nr:GNAT family N-acetyltransferase [bacterium]
MSQAIFSSLFVCGLSSNSSLERYLALSALRDLTGIREGLSDLHGAATRGIRMMVDGMAPVADPSLIRHVSEREGDLAPLLMESRGRSIVDDYRRFRALTHSSGPTTSTWAPRLFVSGQEVIAKTLELPAGTNSVSSFLEDLKSLPADLAGGWPSINFFEDCQALLLGDTVSNLRHARSYLAEMGSEFFGQPILLEDLLAGFICDLPDYRLAALDIEFVRRGHMDIRGTIQTAAGDRNVVRFRRSIPIRPRDGQSWIARSYGIAVAEGSLQGKGIGRRLTQRFLAFLQRLGVDALEFPAAHAGALVFPRLGFDFAGPEARNRVKIQFREFLRKNAPHRDSMDDDNWARVEHAWDIALFRLGNKHPSGRDFLIELGRGGNRFEFPVRFWTRPDYEGWGLLFAERTPPEWNHLAPETRRVLFDYLRTHDQLPALLNSFQDHVANLHEALGNWIFPVGFYLKNRRDHNHLHMLSPEEVQEFHEQFVHTAHLIAWLAAGDTRDTPLGRAFWKTVSGPAWDLMPQIVEAAKEMLDLSIRLPESPAQGI